MTNLNSKVHAFQLEVNHNKRGKKRKLELILICVNGRRG